jgi:lipopolysaccharide transport system ATP-binding protein
LLEVGTGFHPELTGRENVFLNGSMLGLNRMDIIKKFNDIVEFSEVERFLDTPVKFYSSGMYVRLAFAVAAHLEPDVLILDEVLSVGDSNFQKKSFNKIMETMRSGCTVIMVSHNAEAVHSLCKKGVLLDHGIVKSIGKIDNVLVDYKKSQISQLAPTSTIMREVLIHHSKLKLRDNLIAESPLVAEVEFTVTDPVENCVINFYIEDSTGKIAVHSSTARTGSNPSFKPGNYKVKLNLPRLSLNGGSYSSWFRFTLDKEWGEYATDSERNDFNVGGNPTEGSSVIDLPSEWSWREK